MNKFASQLFKSNSSYLTLMTGTLAAQILSLISTIWIANSVQPSEFGKYAFTLTVLLALMPITTRKFETLLVNVEPIYLFSALKKALFRSVILSLITSINLGILAYFYWDFSYLRVVSYVALVFSINVCINFAVLMISINLRGRNFIAVAFSGIWQNGLTLLFQWFLIKMFRDLNGLLFTYAAGRSLSLAAFFFWQEIRDTFNINIFQKSKKSNLEKLKERSSNIFHSSIFDQLSSNSPILIAYFLNNHQLLGYVSMAFNLVMAPATLIISAYSMSFLAQKKWEKDVASKSNKYVTSHHYLALGLLSILYAIVMLIFADNLVNVMFGEEWNRVQDYIRSFSIPISLIIFLTPALQHKVANNETALVKRVQMYGLVIVLMAPGISYLYGSAETAIHLVLYAKIVGQLIPLVKSKQSQ